MLIKIASATAAILTVTFVAGIAKPAPAFAGKRWRPLRYPRALLQFNQRLLGISQHLAGVRFVATELGKREGERNETPEGKRPGCFHETDRAAFRPAIQSTGSGSSPFTW